MKLINLKTSLFSSLATTVLMASGMAGTSIILATPAAAQGQSAKSIVDTAKSRGVIGETAAGYLAIIGGETGAERNAMNEINIGRKALYTRKARDENLQVEVVAAVFGEKQLSKTPGGQKIMNNTGAWVTK